MNQGSKERKNKLTIVFSGKNQSGKLTATNFTIAEYLNKKIGKKRFNVQKTGKEYYLTDSFENDRIIQFTFPCEKTQQLFDTYDFKIYSFSDPVKSIAQKFFCLDIPQCYGDEETQNSYTNLVWEDTFLELREKHAKAKRTDKEKSLATGNIRAIELINLIQNEVFRRIDPHSISRALFNLIEEEAYGLAIVVDGKYPTDVTMGVENSAKVIKLLKGSDHKDIDFDYLQDLPFGEFSLVIDNTKQTPEETFLQLRKHIQQWFYERKI